MCGIVGMFAGCALAPVCPKRALRPSPGNAAQRPYRSSFASWDERASVRRAPRRQLSKAPAPDGPPLFSPSLVPTVHHPIVARREPEARNDLIARHALRYLDFTAKLEHLIVNKTVLSIAHGTCGSTSPTKCDSTPSGSTATRDTTRSSRPI